MGFFSKLFNGLKKTKDTIGAKISNVFKRSELNDEFYDDLEETLITSDVGVETTMYIIDELKERTKKAHIKESEEAKKVLKEIMIEILSVEEVELDYPLILTFVGVNGVGKTTTIGKLANYFIRNKKSVTLVAGDTFRAAASSQLSMWGERSKVRVISQGEGADPSAVVYDGISSAKAKGNDVLLIDTAGRLHNKTNLMEELKKINRVKEKEWPDANQLNLIVLDATTGQNAISQVEAFSDSIGIDAIVLTKLDGSAKGGVVLSIAYELELPILFVGLGEGIEDIEMFDAETFVDAIID
ncbi:MAG: signal recognition particle-docking protein FtsY [Clostridia bacterium]|nr:signal recognition particle-docking protein FtsY [Clostridia bacterium]